MEISFETDSSKGSWNILTPPVLRSLKLSLKDVADVRLAYYALSNYPYEEHNVARCSHPCEGSIGFFIDTQDSHQYLTEEIFFYDFNPMQNPNNFNGLPHWNHERRLNDGVRTWKQKSKHIEFHGITDSPSITLRVTEKSSIIHEKTIKRVPIGQVRKTKIVLKPKELIRIIN